MYTEVNLLQMALNELEVTLGISRPTNDLGYRVIKQLKQNLLSDSDDTWRNIGEAISTLDTQMEILDELYFDLEDEVAGAAYQVIQNLISRQSLGKYAKRKGQRIGGAAVKKESELPKRYHDIEGNEQQPLKSVEDIVMHYILGDLSLGDMGAFIKLRGLDKTKEAIKFVEDLLKNYSEDDPRTSYKVLLRTKEELLRKLDELEYELRNKDNSRRIDL